MKDKIFTKSSFFGDLDFHAVLQSFRRSQYDTVARLESRQDLQHIAEFYTHPDGCFLDAGAVQEKNKPLLTLLNQGGLAGPLWLHCPYFRDAAAKVRPKAA